MIRFAKAHAYGNDFLYVSHSLVAGADEPALAREMCDRHMGVGADGLILFTPTSGGAQMRLWNSDGSRAEVSGNGVRALGALLGMAVPDGPLHLAIQTEGGIKQLTRLERQGNRHLFRASMGVPTGLHQRRIEAAGELLDVVVLNIGNPQLLILVNQLPDDERFHRLGAALEWHREFPQGTNIEFVQVVSPGEVRIRIWERGCGPTTSSGTGSCASLVAAAAYGGAARDAQVVAPGGTQRVEWTQESVYLTGWAEVLCEGEWLRLLPHA
ncbi:MAG: diaminopimelate epimerase [Acidobacteria bacterium]|nr:diaminopimelate epimerase [Acidobacteriota bacterium]